jgi:hypothetical protein
MNLERAANPRGLSRTRSGLAAHPDNGHRIDVLLTEYQMFQSDMVKMNSY